MNDRLTELLTSSKPANSNAVKSGKENNLRDNTQGENPTSSKNTTLEITLEDAIFKLSKLPASTQVYVEYKKSIVKHEPTYASPQEVIKVLEKDFGKCIYFDKEDYANRITYETSRLPTNDCEVIKHEMYFEHAELDAIFGGEKILGHPFRTLRIKYETQNRLIDYLNAPMRS
ncbi:hypothetical protein HN587_03005 [Candidatus Woesearchaeota archaeon]|jgi:hypothetical protein|nr:hypothetical protein [Candidatus Woesearchaeota archaeon]